MLSITKEIQKAIKVVERDASAGTGKGFAARVAAMERIEIHVMDRLKYLGERVKLPKELKVLAGKAKDLHRRVEKANERELEKLRNQIKSSLVKPKELFRRLARYAGSSRYPGAYDTLDSFVWGLLCLGDKPIQSIVLEPEMVGNQPIPARAILSLIKRAKIRPSDVFYDLGSGLGQVAILVALFTGASARGIEIDPAFNKYAKRCSRRLNVPNVKFTHGDARKASLAGGTVYFLYTPFRGSLLRLVLERLRVESKKRTIKVCTYGPCVFEVAKERWLKPKEGRKMSGHEVSVFQSK